MILAFVSCAAAFLAVEIAYRLTRRKERRERDAMIRYAEAFAPGGWTDAQRQHFESDEYGEKF